MCDKTRNVKIARPDHEITDYIGNRWSPYAFGQKTVEHDKLFSMLEAARWAPSSFNEQPWRFIIAARKNLEEFNAMLECLSLSNRRWAANAPVLLMTVAARKFQKNSRPNRHAFHDVGLAMGNLLAQATSFGIFVHQAAGFDVAKARETYTIPDDFEPVAISAIGYLGKPESLPDDIRDNDARPRNRKSLNEIAYSGKWESAFNV